MKTATDSQALAFSNSTLSKQDISRALTALAAHPEFLREVDAASAKAKVARHFPDLLSETRPTVDTATAAHWLSRRPQTLRIWSLTGSPIRPLRVNGRLAWRVADILTLLGVA